MDDYERDGESGARTAVLTEELRREVIENHCGREAGWFVEFQGQRLALLSDCWHQYPDMFWDQYTITWLTQDAALLARAKAPAFWWENEFVFINRKYPDVSVAPAQMLSPHLEEGLMGVRGLYLDVEVPQHEVPPAVPRPLWKRLKARWRGGCE